MHTTSVGPSPMHWTPTETTIALPGAISNHQRKERVPANERVKRATRVNHGSNYRYLARKVDQFVLPKSSVTRPMQNS